MKRYFILSLLGVLAIIGAGCALLEDVLITGLFSTEKAEETALAGLDEGRGTLELKGSVIANGDTTNKRVRQISFKMTNSAGAESADLEPDTTRIIYADANNRVNAIHISDARSGEVRWSHSWILGSGDNLDPGEVVQFTVDISALDTPLRANAQFKVEVIPPQDAVLIIQRTTPLEITAIMDLD